MPADPARAQELFLAALDVPDQAARAAYLDGACAGDTELRARVEALLRAHEQPNHLLDAPVVPPPGDAAPTRTFAPEANAAGTTDPDTGDGFELGEEIGRGATGVVFRARQRGLNRVVAVKMAVGLERAARHAPARFLAEAEAVAAISHPHVVRVFGFGQRDGVPYLAMEYLSGGTLADRIRSGPLAPRAAAELIGKVASGVAAAHAQGIVHRDLKPSNVLLDENGEPKVTDFGLARRGAGSDLTATHAVMGTPAYMAPEQARGGGKFAGPPADVWALGVVLYECVAGERPFEGASDEEVLSRITAGSPPALRTGSRAVPRDFETIVTKCLAPEPDHRYPTAAELADDLERFLRGEPIMARPVGRAERLARWVRRKPTAAAAYGFSALAVVLALVVFVVAGLWRAAEGAKLTAEGAKKDADDARGRVEALLGTEKGLRLDLEGTNRKLEGANAGLQGAKAKLETALGGERAAKRQAETLAEKLARVEYGRTVQVAHQAWRDGNNARARALLGGTRPALRGWEWEYARRLCADPLVTVPEPGPIELVSWDPSGTRILTAGPNRHPRIWTADGRFLAILDGHRQAPLSAVWSSDGRRVLTTGEDSTIRAWDAESGKQLFVLGPVRSPDPPAAAWSPDGTKVAAVYSPAVLTRRGVILDAATGKVLAELELGRAGSSDVPSIAWSPSGDRVVAPRTVVPPGGGTEQKTADVFDAKTGKVLFTLKGHKDVVRTASFNPDGTKIATGSFDRTVRLWDAKTGKELAVLRGAATWVVAVLWSPDGSRLVALPATQREIGILDRDHTARVWDAETQKQLAALEHPGEVTSAAWSPDGGRIVTASDGVVWVWDAEAGRRVGVVRNHAGGLSAPAYSPDGTRILTAAYDGVPGGKQEFSARVWDARTGVAAFAVPVEEGYRYWQSPDGFRVLVGATLWDARTGRKVAELDLANEGLSSVAWRPDGTRFVTVGASEEGPVRVWDATTGNKLGALRGQAGPIDATEWSPDGTRIAIAARDGTIKVWDAATGEVAVALAGYMPEVASVEWSPDGARVLAVAVDGTLRVWDAKTGRVIATPNEPLPFQPGVVSWSPDRSRFVAGGWLWSADTGERLAALRGQRVASAPVVWNRDGSLFAAADSDSVFNEWRGNARVWDTRTGSEVAVIASRDKDRRITPRLFVWSPDGSRLALVTDGVRIWDVKGNKEVAFLDGRDANIEWVVWSPDGKRVATDRHFDNVTHTEHTRVWDVETGKAVASLAPRKNALGRSEPGQLNRDGSRLATADGTGSVRVWDAKTGKESVVLAANSLLPSWVTWNPNGTVLAVAHQGTVRVWDCVSEKELAVIADHNWGVRDRPRLVAWTPDGARLVTADYSDVRVWDLKAAKVVAQIAHKDIAGVTKGDFVPSDNKRPINAAALSPDGTRIATASADHTARVWDAATGKQLAVLAGHPGEVYSVQWTSDGARVVTTASDLRVWDATTGKPVFVSDFASPLSSFPPFDRHFAGVGSDGVHVGVSTGDYVHVVDTRAGKVSSFRVFGGYQRKPLSGPSRWWSPDGSRIAVWEGTHGHTDAVRVWDAATGRVVATLRSPSTAASAIHSAGWSPDGTRIVITGWDSTVDPKPQQTYLARVWDVRTATASVVLTGHTGTVHAAVWNHDGTKLVTTSADGTARLYDAATGAGEAVLGGHAGEWVGAAWSPDGARVATVSDNAVRVWDSSTGAELLMLTGERPDGRRRDGARAPLRWSRDGWRLSLAPPWIGFDPEAGAVTIWDATPLDRPAVPPEVAPPPRAKAASE